VQEALAAVNADKANITASELQLKNLQTNMKLQWGEALAKLAFNDKLPPHLENLLNRKNVLIQVSLPLSKATPKAGSSIDVTPLNESSSPIKAIYVSPASTSDSNGFGKTFYYSAPADQLRIGMRVNVEAASSDSTSGIIIPSSAVVWYAGTPWAYFKQGKDQFVRKPISADTEVEAGWFNQGLDANSEVVVNGAQLLLSEEFKYLIKNENED
jgi:multidrug efflux pump subunit AcrA (membrane-fusion protein)